MSRADRNTLNFSSSQPTNGFHWRCVLQYRLRTLLVVMTIIAAWMGWWSHSARQQRGRVDALKKAGALISYDLQDPSEFGADDQRTSFWPWWLIEHLGIDYFAGVDCVRFGISRDTDSDVQLLKGLTVRRLDLSKTQITDAGLKRLPSLPSLVALDLSETQVTDAGLEHLAAIHSLRGLNISTTPITDSGTMRLRSMSSLIVLDLSETQITDAGLGHLKALIALQGLNLKGTHVTENGLKNLKELNNLTLLLVSSKIADSEGAARLKNTLVHCEIREGRLESISVSTRISR